MNRRLARAVVDCLRFDSSAAPALDRIARFGERDWKTSYRWLDDSGLVLYFLHRLTELQAENVLPACVRDRFKDNLEKNRLRVAEMAKEFGALTGGFEEAGVQYVAEKGFTLVPEYCSDAGLRLQLDLDFLVSRATVEQAQAVIRSIGYFQAEASGPPDRPWEIGFRAGQLRRPTGNEDYYRPPDQRSVELHFDLWESDREGVEEGSPEEVFGRSVSRSWNGIPYRALGDEDALIQKALHTFKDIKGCWCRPSLFLEIASFLRNRSVDDTFWARFRDRVGDRAMLADSVNFTFSMALNLLGGTVPAGGWTNQPPNPALSLWVQRYGSDWALADYPGSKLPLLLYPQFIQSRSLCRKALTTKLFPRRSPGLLAFTETPQPWSLGAARRRRWGILVGRANYHGVELLRLCWHYPRWRRALSRSEGAEATA